MEMSSLGLKLEMISDLGVGGAIILLFVMVMFSFLHWIDFEIDIFGVILVM